MAAVGLVVQWLPITLMAKEAKPELLVVVAPGVMVATLEAEAEVMARTARMAMALLRDRVEVTISPGIKGAIQEDWAELLPREMPPELQDQTFLMP
jgi:hypothetical protein